LVESNKYHKSGGSVQARAAKRTIPDFKAGEAMKLISVQSRGDRLARIVKQRIRPFYCFTLWGKRIRYSEEWGATIDAEILGSYDTDRQAIKAAAKWLEGATLYQQHI